MKKRKVIGKLNTNSTTELKGFDRAIEFKWLLPFNLILICRLMEISPENLIKDFCENLSHGSWNRQDRDEAKESLIGYFLQMQYGQHRFSSGEIRQIFEELDAIGLLFPNDADEILMDLHVKWREKYFEYWFEKWFSRNQRKL